MSLEFQPLPPLSRMIEPNDTSCVGVKQLRKALADAVRRICSAPWYGLSPEHLELRRKCNAFVEELEAP